MKKAEFVNNGLINVPNILIEYRGFNIVPKKDFGRYPHQNVNVYYKGYVVTDGICNVMPGAVWFISVVEAKNSIDTLIESKETGRDYWEISREKDGLAEWEEV